MIRVGRLPGLMMDDGSIILKYFDNLDLDL
jgi:hypothetical protein